MPPRLVGDGAGRSAPTRARNVGAAAAPELGPAHTVLALCVARPRVMRPFVVTGEPVTLNIPGALRPTLVTVPVPHAAPESTRLPSASISTQSPPVRGPEVVPMTVPVPLGAYSPSTPALS